MSENEKPPVHMGYAADRIKKINVTSARLGAGLAPAEIHRVIETKANEVARSHNTRFVRKGAELLRAIKLVGLEPARTDELMGRLLETNALAASDPGKIAEWILAGETLRHQHNPQGREGVFSAVVHNVEPDSKTAEALQELGLKYKPRYEAFEGSVDIDAVLSKLAGTSASLRVRVGKQGRKGRENYIVVLQDGAENKDARNILLRSDKTAPTAGAGAGAGAGASAGEGEGEGGGGGEGAGMGTNADTAAMDDKQAGARAASGRGFGQRAFSGPNAGPAGKDKSAQ